MSVYHTGEEDALPFRSLLSIKTADIIDADRRHILYGMSKVSYAMALCKCLKAKGKTRILQLPGFA